MKENVAELQFITLKLSSFLDILWISRFICEGVVERLGYKMAWVGLIDERSYEVKPLTQAGFEKGCLQTIKVRYDDSPLGRGPTGTAIRKGIPVIQRRETY